MIGQRGKQGIQGKQGIPGKDSYIDAKTFTEFCSNQKQLIDILNHRMSSMESNIGIIKNDVSWTKKLLWAILGTGITAVLVIIINSLLGA